MRGISIKHPGSADVLTEVDVPRPIPKSWGVIVKSPHRCGQSYGYHASRKYCTPSALPDLRCRGSLVKSLKTQVTVLSFQLERESMV